MDTLNKMEQIEVDKKDEPIEDIVITSIEVFVDPFKEAVEQLAQDRAEETAKVERQHAEERQKKRLQEPLKVYRVGVGKYLNLQVLKKSIVAATSSSSSGGKIDSIATQSAPSNKKSKARSELNDFSKW